MYLLGKEIRIENEHDRTIAHIAAIASDPTKGSPLPKIENLTPPFTLGDGSRGFITQGLANIALGKNGVLYESVPPELADQKLTELYGEIDSPEDFASPLPDHKQHHN
jgi:hypothetical protein